MGSSTFAGICEGYMEAFPVIRFRFMIVREQKNYPNNWSSRKYKKKIPIKIPREYRDFIPRQVNHQSSYRKQSNT